MHFISMTMDSPNHDHIVVVWLAEAIPFDAGPYRRTVVSNRHVVHAARLLQDAATSTFVDSNGEVVATYPTSLVIDVEWDTVPEAQSQAPQSAATTTRYHSLLDQYPDESELKKLPVGSEEWREMLSQLFPMAYQPWTSEEEDQLREECAAGLSHREIALIHGRRIGGITSRIAHLEIEQ